MSGLHQVHPTDLPSSTPHTQGGNGSGGGDDNGGKNGDDNQGDLIPSAVLPTVTDTGRNVATLSGLELALGIELGGTDGVMMANGAKGGGGGGGKGKGGGGNKASPRKSILPVKVMQGFNRPSSSSLSSSNKVAPDDQRGGAAARRGVWPYLVKSLARGLLLPLVGRNPKGDEDHPSIHVCKGTKINNIRFVNCPP